jgi:hypothetical protein
MHLRQRDEVLTRLASWVAPGGWLVISDSIDLTTSGSPYLPYRQAMAAMWRTLHELIGTDIEWVRDTPRLLRHAGLADVGTEIYLPSADHRSTVARFWSLTWTQLHDDLIKVGGIEPASLDHAIAALADPAFTETSPGMISSWGRRPPA